MDTIEPTTLTPAERDDLLQRFTIALQHADENELAATVTDDVVWTLPGTNLMSGLAHGVAGVLARSNAINEYEVTLDLEKITYGYATSALRLHNHGTHNGKTLNEYLATVFHFRDGKISRIDTHVSDLDMLNTFFV